MSDNRWNRRDLVKMLSSAPLLLILGPQTMSVDKVGEHFWGYAVDIRLCIGCGNCMRACRIENGVPDGFYRTWVERYRVGTDGSTYVDVAESKDLVFKEIEGEVSKAFFVPKLCNQCEKSVCTQVCPVGASYFTPDGVVMVDPKHCIGCGYCVQACPYGSRFINPYTHVADKCTLCYHRIHKGLEPACVAMCPTGARIFGDLKDPHGKLSTILRQNSYRVLKPEMGTVPKCYYQGLDREVV
jgi:tetrathionate reductase subunit B